MQTILNIFNPNITIPSKGVVDIVDLYDRRYFNIFLDGVLVEFIRKGKWDTTIIKRKFINKCVSQSGVDSEKLVFVLVDLYSFGEENISDYDANDYDDYQDIISVINSAPTTKPNYNKYAQLLATGISELETKI